jgi:DNA-3-methyladenine glycosylase II
LSKIVVLDDQTEAVRYLANKDKRLAKAMRMVGPITYEIHEDPYPFLVHEIIEQMLSVKAGAKIYGRLEEMCNGKITPEAVHVLSVEQIRGIGTSSAKARYIHAATDAILEGSIRFSDLEQMHDEDVIKALTELPGIGMWTAKMYLIFVLDRQNVLPFEDVAFLQSYQWLYKTDDRSPEAVKKKCKKWQPYSSVAARYLYRALDMGFTKNEFHLYGRD